VKIQAQNGNEFLPGETLIWEEDGKVYSVAYDNIRVERVPPWLSDEAIIMEDDPKMRMGWKWLSVSDKRFHNAMRVHDWSYRFGSAAQSTGMTRKEVDYIFLRMCLIAAVYLY